MQGGRGFVEHPFRPEALLTRNWERAPANHVSLITGRIQYMREKVDDFRIRIGKGGARPTARGGKVICIGDGDVAASRAGGSQASLVRLEGGRQLRMVAAPGGEGCLEKLRSRNTR